MDNVGVVVEDLATTIEVFRALGLELEGEALVEGAWAGRVTGLGEQRVEVAMMRTLDGHSRLELSRFVTPAVVADHRTAPVNSLGYLRVMFGAPRRLPGLGGNRETRILATLASLRRAGDQIRARFAACRGHQPSEVREAGRYQLVGRSAFRGSVLEGRRNGCQ